MVFNDESPCKTNTIPSESNVHKRRLSTSKNDDSSPKDKKLKPSIPLRTKILPKKTSKATAPNPGAKTPLKVRDRNHQQTSDQSKTKNSFLISPEIQSPGVSGKCNMSPPAEQGFSASQPGDKELTPTTLESQKCGREMCDDLVSNDIKFAIQRALDEHVQCLTSFRVYETKFKESSEKLKLLIELIKKHLPSVLDSLPSEISESFEDLHTPSEGAQEDLIGKEDAVLKRDVDLVQKLLIVLKEFNSYALVLEKHPEGEVIKESLLRDMKAKEDLFEKNLIKFKLNKSWLLTSGIKALDSQAQIFIRNKYKNYFELLDMELKEMKVKINQLTQTPFNRSTSTSDSSDSRDFIHHISSSPVSTLSSNEGSSEVFLKKDVVENVIKNNDEEENKIETNKSLVDVPVQSWPGKSLPSLEDLVSDDSEGGTDSSVPTIGSKETEVVQNMLAHMKQDELTHDQYIVENLITQVGPELDISEGRDESQDVGSHFLATQLATVCSPTGQGFLYNVAVKPTQKPGWTYEKKASSPAMSCSECQETFQNNESLISHKSFNHVNKICNLCTTICVNMRALRDHVESVHTSSRLCLDCGIVVETSSFTDHASSHLKTTSVAVEKLKCRVCLKSFSSQEKVKTHEKSHKNAFYQCKNCGDLFLTRFELQDHSSMHLAEVVDKCKVCQLGFCEKSSLIRHLKMAHHMTTNKIPDMYECILCDCLSSNQTELVEHMRCFHQNDYLVFEASNGEDKGPPKHKCLYCNSFFKNTKVRAVHKILFHEMPAYVCGCGAEFFVKAMFDKHALEHTRTEEENMKKTTAFKKNFGC